MAITCGAALAECDLQIKSENVVILLSYRVLLFIQFFSVSRPSPSSQLYRKANIKLCLRFFRFDLGLRMEPKRSTMSFSRTRVSQFFWFLLFASRFSLIVHMNFGCINKQFWWNRKWNYYAVYRWNCARRFRASRRVGNLLRKAFGYLRQNEDVQRPEDV